MRPVRSTPCLSGAQVNPAEELYRQLDKLGVTIHPAAPFAADGERVCAKSPDGVMWQQLHVDARPDDFGSKCIEALAKVIAQRSKNIRFGELFIPSGDKGVLSSARHVSSEVRLRELTALVPMPSPATGLCMDVTLKRIDALFCDVPHSA